MPRGKCAFEGLPGETVYLQDRQPRWGWQGGALPPAQLSSLILSGKIEQKGSLELNPSGKQSPGEPCFWSLLECQEVTAGEGVLEMDGPSRPMTVPMGWATLASSLFLDSGLL